MKKKEKVTAIQIAPFRRPAPIEKLKKINLEKNPEWTINYFFKPHLDGIMYEAIRKEKKNG